MTETVFLVDDDAAVLRSLSLLLGLEGFRVQTYESALSFLDDVGPDSAGCVVLDLRMPGMSGIQAQEALLERGIDLPVIFLTGHGDVSNSVHAMKGGAFDFLQKPVPADTLIASVHGGLRLHAEHRRKRLEQEAARARLAHLTVRESEVLALLLRGHSNKETAKLLDISPRTIETHRKSILEKTGTNHLVELSGLYQVATKKV